ncbi:MAG TPA: pitrilysin family protein [Vicinamibacterales bacterium]|nr:pitrilysin family protein [Vicinamibacterales bacterium]
MTHGSGGGARRDPVAARGIAKRLCCGLATAALTFLAGAASAQVANWPSERPPRPLSARQVKFPPYQFKTLANGLQVIAVSHHEQPAVSLRLILRAGGAQDPVDKPGVAALAAALLDQGTTTRQAEQIAQTIDSIGGAIGTGAGTDLTYVNAVVMKDSLDLALDLVSEIARRPAFAPEEIERQRQQMLSSLKVSYQDPDYIARVVFDRLVYGVHPYGLPASGTAASIASITRDDLVAFHKTWFGANNAILAVVGDVTAEEAFAGAERALGKWERVPQTVTTSTEPPPPTRRVVVIDRPGAVQTEIRVGNIALPRKHPDFLALDLALKILGGEGGNRLHRVLRSERGLTYGASAEINALKEAGDLVAETDTRSETTGEALRLIVDEMWRLQRTRVQERELADAQAYLTGNFPLTIETPSAIALQILNAIFYGLDLDELQTFRERVNAVTPDDIQRVAREYFRPDRLSIVLVGDASVFAGQLPGVGFEQFERIPLSALDLASADLRRASAVPARRDGPPPGESRAGGGSGMDARALIDRAVQAKGGLAKLRSIRTMKVEASMLIDSGQDRVEVPTTTWIRYPDSFRIDARLPADVVTQMFTGGDFWVQDRRGVRQAPAEVAAEMRTNVQRDSIPLLLALADGRVTPRRVSDGDETGPMLEVETAGMRLTLVFDARTALIRRQRYVVLGAASATVAEETFSDYRDVDGVQVAFKAVVRREGAPRVERSVTHCAFNVQLPPSVFARPG